MIKKELVKKNFSKSTNSYDSFANVQKHMAKELMKNLNDDLNEVKILEIGSGTGILTNYLISKYQNSQITLIDISEPMIESCRNKFGNRLNYIVSDAENYEFENKFDLIISNATFQWFNNLNETVEKYKNILNENGKMLFSIFAEGTYKELNESFLKVSEEYKYSQNFIGLEELKKIGKILKEEYYMEEYKSLLEFLKSIKGIGAQSSLTNKKVLTPNIIKAVEKEYLASYKKILVSNSLAYVEVN